MPLSSVRLLLTALALIASPGLAVAADGNSPFHARYADEPGYPGDFGSLLAAGSERLFSAGIGCLSAPALSLEDVELLPPLASRPQFARSVKALRGTSAPAPGSVHSTITPS